MPRRVRYRFDIFKFLLILIPCLYFLPELTGQSYFAGWDITRLNLPLKWFDVQSLRHGALPLWNPYLYAGMPQLAESESGFFYPGNILMHLPGDFFYLANLTYILHFILAGLFMDLWLRGRGIEPKISFFGAVLYQTAPFLVFHITSMALFQSIVWFPLLLWLADRYIDTPDCRVRRLIFGWLFILGGMLVFVGSAQMAFYQGFLLFWYLIGTIAADRSKEALRPLKALGIIASLILGAVLIGAIIWIPAMEFARTTVREASGKAFYFLGSNWLTPVRLASLFYFPAYAKQTDVVGWASSLIYIGLLPTIAAMLRLAGIKVNWKKDAPLIVMGAVALILAFGMRNPVNHILIKFPPFEMFRYQGRFALGVIVALIPLACSWMSENMNGVNFSRTRLKWVIGIVFALFAVFILTTLRAKPVLIGGIILVIDILLSWYGISALMRYSLRYPTLQRGSVQSKNGPTINRPTINGGVPTGESIPPRYPTLQRGSVQSKYRPTINRPTINGGVPGTFPNWIALYLIFHLVIVFPVGRLATMKAGNFNEAMKFFETIRRDDGVEPRLLVTGVGKFADRDLLEFNHWEPQDHLPNLCAGNTGAMYGVQVMDPYTPLRPLVWDRLIRETISKEFENATDGTPLDNRTALFLEFLGIDAVVTTSNINEIRGYHLVQTGLEPAFGSDARLFIADEGQARVYADVSGPEHRPGKGSISISSNMAIIKTEYYPWHRYQIDLGFGPQYVIEISADLGWEAWLKGERIKPDVYNLERLKDPEVPDAILTPFLGTHGFTDIDQLQLIFRPKSVRIGGIVSILGILIVILGIFLDLPSKWSKSPLP